MASKKIEKVKKMLREYSALSGECEQLEKVIASLNKEHTRAMHSKVYDDERRKRIADAASEAITTLTDLQLNKIARQLEIENLINKLSPELSEVIRAKYILRMHAHDIAAYMSVRYMHTCSERQVYRYRDAALAELAKMI